MFNAELSEIVRIAIGAGDKILLSRDTQNNWAKKHDGSPVTAADKIAEIFILAELEQAFPNVCMVGEERASEGHLPDDTEETFFLIDALDGTREFINGSDEYTVNIARITNGQPELGVIVAPSLSVGFASNANVALKFDIDSNGPSNIQEISARPPKPDLCAVVSRSHATPETIAFLQQYTVAQKVSYGSSLKLCKIADGSADIYPRLGRTMEWDIAAGDAILRAAGGSVRTLDGNDLVYGKTKQADSPFANPHFVAFGNWSDEAIRTSFAKFGANCPRAD